jgi:exonuclease V
MERGTRVHKILEEQVHTVVPVELTTAEDVWGLKLFNMYQGLLSLGQQGLARELPVFGFWGEVMISGIIDEISYLPPESRAMDSAGVGDGDPEQEKKRRRGRRGRRNGGIENALTAEKFKVPKGRGAKVAYVCDTKTRSSKSLPSASQVKATGLQLMLYNRLLGELRSGKTDFGMVLKLFELDGSARFSDSFIAEIAELDQSTPLEKILEKNSLWGMWSFVQKQIERSIDSMGDSMGVSYRNQDDGGLIGFQAVENEVNVLDDHLKVALAWWKGERSTVGVEIEDAWKCELALPSTRCTRF